MDVKNAFTESHLKEKIYLSPLKGVKVRKGYVLRVPQSLYRLKQAARDWNNLCCDHLRTIGFKQSLANPCLFIYSNRIIQLLVYIDDILCATENAEDTNWVHSKLLERFNTKNLGLVTKLLGMRIMRDRTKREIFLDQEQYLVRVLKKFGMENAIYKKRGIPMRNYENLMPTQPMEERHDLYEY
jgi:hypothetical protein